MSALEQFLRSESVGLVRIDGKVTGKKRDELVKRFQEDNLVSVCLSERTTKFVIYISMKLLE